MKTPRGKRISSIDMLRGLVMVIMAIDHVRDYFHYDAFFFDPTDMDMTYPSLFWTRFITHFCAPVFVFLAGTSAFFVGQRKGKKFLSAWLVKRGVWLLIAEFTIIKLAWMFKLDYSMVLLQVIWVLGLGMLFLAAYIYLPKKLGILLALIAVFGHNALDVFNPANAFEPPATEAGPVLWTLMHVFGFAQIGGTTFWVAYTVIPWVFVMALGYYFGDLYKSGVLPEVRYKKLLQLGISLTVIFVVLRILNIYGDPLPWESRETFSHTLMSFFNVNKYPPSLLFLLVTIGPSIIFLAFAERWKGRIFEKLVIIGRVPMFFYVVHLYLIHGLAVIAAVATGFQASDMLIDVWVTIQPELQGYGFNLWIVYLIWALVVIGLYPVCAWYNKYKTDNREKWWLTYL